MSILITDDQYAADVEHSLTLRAIGYLIRASSRGSSARLGERVLFAADSAFEQAGAPHDPQQIRAHLAAAIAVVEREQERIEQRASLAIEVARAQGADPDEVNAAALAVFVQEGLKPGEALLLRLDALVAVERAEVIPRRANNVRSALAV